MLIYIKWLLIALLKLPLLLTVPVAAVIVPLFYRADKDENKDLYKRKFLGGFYIPFDNPVQGRRRTHHPRIQTKMFV